MSVHPPFDPRGLEPDTVERRRCPLGVAMRGIATSPVATEAAAQFLHTPLATIASCCSAFDELAADNEDKEAYLIAFAAGKARWVELYDDARWVELYDEWKRR